MTMPAQVSLNANDLPAPPLKDPAVQSMYQHGVMISPVVGNQEQHSAAANAASESPARPLESGPPPSIQTESLAKVYEQSGVCSPNHGFTILKIADMLGSLHIRDLSHEGKRSAILMALEANGVRLNDIIEDASRRDDALNRYEARQQKTLQDFKNWKQQQNREIQSEIDLLVQACRSRIEDNEKEIASEKARFDDWRQKKREEERRIRTASSHFVQGSAVQQSSGNTETVAPADAPPELAPAPARPMEARVMESPAASNGKAPLAQGAANGGGKRPSLWKK